MSNSFEKTLKKLMFGFGKIIEKLIGQAQKAKATVGTRGGLQPILSLESQISANKINEMIIFSTKRNFLPIVPNLENQTALEITQGTPICTQRFLQQQAKYAIALDTSTTLKTKQGDIGSGFIIKGNANRTPFKNDFFQYIAARFTANNMGDINEDIKEMGRILTHGGTGVLIDFHPFGLYSKKGSNRIISAESDIKGIEDYYKIFKTSGLRILEIRESFIDESFRQLFESKDIQFYRNVKGTPLIIFIYFFKPRLKTN